MLSFSDNSSSSGIAGHMTPSVILCAVSLILKIIDSRALVCHTPDSELKQHLLGTAFTEIKVRYCSMIFFYHLPYHLRLGEGYLLQICG